jgi:transcriptional regulator with XRE-family HTH domain
MTKKEQIISLAEQCHTYSEIARITGVSRQYVSQVIVRIGKPLTDFRKLSEKDCVYDGIRNWWNSNRMSYHKFFDLMGMRYHQTNITRLQRYFSGEFQPRKDYIDRLISVTGLSYEQLFSREGD